MYLWLFQLIKKRKSEHEAEACCTSNRSFRCGSHWRVQPIRTIQLIFRAKNPKCGHHVFLAIQSMTMERKTGLFRTKPVRYVTYSTHSLMTRHFNYTQMHMDWFFFLNHLKKISVEWTSVPKTKTILFCFVWYFSQYFSVALSVFHLPSNYNAGK